jgi:hypothetical protein
MEGDVTGVHVLDRLLVSRESGKAPISDIDDLLEIGRIGKNEKRGTGSPDTDPDLTGWEEGDQVGVGPGARVGSLTDTHSGERGATPESIFESKVPDMVVVRKDPSGRETGEWRDKNRKFARKTGEASGTDSDLAIAVDKKSVGPFPVVGMAYKKASWFNEMSPNRLNGRVRREGRSAENEIQLGRTEDGIQRVG